ncbi:MAG: XRE family transcriptional regulator [Acidimicrobiaceae bacterium]|nr:XRE family transcriptional regulator [Acidimicrobiaceae bacterium]
MNEQERSGGPLSEALARARLRAHFTQEEVGAALGVSRAMVSYWESGTRKPNDRQFSALARLYGVMPAELLEGQLAGPGSNDLAGLLLRDGDGIGPSGATGLREFVQLLDRFAELRRIVDKQAGCRIQSPFAHRPSHTSREDARRKAQEVRVHLSLGAGPIGDIDSACEALGVIVFQTPLGSDLYRAATGAFLRHPEVGLSVLVNHDMSAGRRCFATAHGLAHALFHSHETNQVLCRGVGPRESFADAFAGEFLMPSSGVRRLAELLGLPRRISDPADIVYVQQYFKVSWPTALVRLRQMNAITRDTYADLTAKGYPGSLARALGYPAHPEPNVSGPAVRPLQQFPRSFLRMLRQTVVARLMSPNSAAAFAGLAVPDIAQLTSQLFGSPEQESPQLETEFHEFEVTGVA